MVLPSPRQRLKWGIRAVQLGNYCAMCVGLRALQVVSLFRIQLEFNRLTEWYSYRPAKLVSGEFGGMGRGNHLHDVRASAHLLHQFLEFGSRILPFKELSLIHI